jgi:hypothetical protein
LKSPVGWTFDPKLGEESIDSRDLARSVIQFAPQLVLQQRIGSR